MRLRFVPFIVALVATSVPVPPAAAEETPLPTIGTTRASLACTAVKQEFAPSLLAITTNDRIFTQSRTALAKMAMETISPGPGSAERLSMQRQKLAAMVRDMAANTVTIAKLANAAEKSQPADPDVAATRAAVRAVIDEQRRTVDRLASVVDSQSRAQMGAELPVGGAAVASDKSATVGGTTETTIDDAPSSPLFTMGFHKDPMPEPLQDGNRVMHGLGHTIYDGLSRSVGDGQAAIAKREVILNTAITTIVRICNDQRGAP